MSRSLLHRDKLENFKSWLSSKGIETRDGKGDYQVLQIKVGKDWICVFDRNRGAHYTTDSRLDSLVKKFIRSQ